MIDPVLPDVAISWQLNRKRTTPFRGKAAAHSIITKSSRRYHRGEGAAFERAIEVLRAEYLASVSNNDDAICHLILAVQEREST